MAGVGGSGYSFRVWTLLGIRFGDFIGYLGRRFGFVFISFLLNRIGGIRMLFFKVIGIFFVSLRN